MFDASNYVLGPYLYCCWSLVLFWALFVAFWWWFLGGGIDCSVLLSCGLFWGWWNDINKRSANLISWGGAYSVSWCVRPWIKLTPEYPFKPHLSHRDEKQFMEVRARFQTYRALFKRSILLVKRRVIWAQSAAHDTMGFLESELVMGVCWAEH